MEGRRKTERGSVHTQSDVAITQGDMADAGVGDEADGDGEEVGEGGGYGGWGKCEGLRVGRTREEERGGGEDGEEMTHRECRWDCESEMVLVFDLLILSIQDAS